MNKTRHLKCQAPKRDDYKQERKYTNDVCYGKLGSTIIRTIEIHNCSFVASSYIRHSLKKTPTQMDAHQIFVIFCMPPHFLACKLYARKVRKFATTNCLVTKPRKSIWGVLLVGWRNIEKSTLPPVVTNISCVWESSSPLWAALGRKLTNLTPV